MKDNIKRELINKQLKGYQEAIELIPQIVEVAKKFDGKVISKRFDTAIKKVNKNLSFTLEYNSFRVKYYNRDRYISGESYAEYIQEDVVDLVFGCIKSSYGDGICQDGVFVFDNFVKGIEGRKGMLAKYIKETSEQLERVEQLTKEQKQLKEAIEQHNDGVNFIVEYYYGVRVK